MINVTEIRIHFITETTTMDTLSFPSQFAECCANIWGVDLLTRRVYNCKAKLHAPFLDVHRLLFYCCCLFNTVCNEMNLRCLAFGLFTIQSRSHINANLFFASLSPFPQTKVSYTNNTDIIITSSVKGMPLPNSVDKVSRIQPLYLYWKKRQFLMPGKLQGSI